MAFCIVKNLCSQSENGKSDFNHLFVEFAGLGGYGSVNYERIFFSKEAFSFSARTGIGLYKLRDYTNVVNPDLNFPFTLNVLVGKNNKFELGLGQVFSSIAYHEMNKSNKQRQTYSHSILAISYRYNLTKYGVILRCSYYPIFEFNKYLRHSGGISIGYAF